MNLTQKLGKRGYGRANRIVLGAVAALIVISILAFAALWAMGTWPASRAQNESALGIDADAARYNALGQAQEDARLSSNPELRVSRSYAASTAASGASALPYTDVSRFYVERMRAQAREARENGILAANPELMFARRAYRIPGALTNSPHVPTCSVNC